MFGGESANFDIRDDTWTFNGSTWTALTIAAPQPRVEASLAYDCSRDVAVLTGGFSLTQGDQLDQLWELDCVTPATDLGFGKAAVNGFYPQFRICGAIETGSSAAARVRKAPAQQLGMILASLQAQPTPAFGGTLVPAHPTLVGPFVTDAEGDLDIALQGGIGLGPLDVFAQWVFLDPSASFGIGISNALQVEVLP